MKLITAKARLLLCGVIITAFFIPAYQNISGFTFIKYAFSEAKFNSEITQFDVLITIVPLLSIPLSALFILVRTRLYIFTRKTFLALPLLFMFFFFWIIYLSARNSASEFSSPTVFFQMQAGFYITALASLLLIFTKAYKKRRRRRSVHSTEVVATA